MRIALVSNPLSRRNSRGISAISAAAAAHPRLRHHVLVQFEELPSVIESLIDEGVDLLVINGGDGTVRAVLTELLTKHRFEPTPLLAILPGGTTNSIAADVGPSGNSCKSLHRLVEATGQNDLGKYIVTRNIIRVETGSDHNIQYGMLFASAGLCPGIRLRRRLFPQTWIPEVVAGALTVMGLLCSSVIGGQMAKPLRDGETVTMALDNEAGIQNTYSLLMISTLASSYFNSRPFWGNEPGSLKYSRIVAPTDGLLRNILPYLFGGDERRLPATYQSGAADNISLQMSCEFLLDGEFFRIDPEQTLKLSATEPLRFLRC